VPPPSNPQTKPLAAIACSTVLGVGYAPVAPGTFGSAAGLVLWAVLPASMLVHGCVILCLFGLGVWSASAVGPYFRSGDPGPVVIDEVMGMLITLVHNPVHWPGALLGFLLFRVLDIVKPYPARRLERLHGGLGVMADDAMAGIYANLALRALIALAGS
jgi:phosphatidylglycerophosphatase A